MSKSEIQWTDYTWNVVTGCDRVSAGCDHCYALTLAKRLKAMGNPRYQNDGNPKTSGPGFGVTLHPDKLTDPLYWRKPQKVFVNSMSDLWHADVPTEFIAQVFAAMALAPRHTFQVLTKRPRRQERCLNDVAFWDEVADAAMQRREDWPRGQALPEIGPTRPLPNVWLGTSVENQEAAFRIDWLVKTPAAVRFLSCEPLIGPLDLSRWLWEEAGPEWAGKNPSPDLGWVIVGAESGHGARPMAIDWAREIKNQCVSAGVPFFLKQFAKNGKKIGTPELDGVQWVQMPSN